MLGVEKPQREKRARESLPKAGLSEEYYDHYSNQLSGGQMQRVAIARALVNDPSIIFADEPTGNLDTKTGEIVLDTFGKLNEEHGHTIVLITHERDVAEYANRIITVRDGLIVDDSINKNRRTSMDASSISVRLNDDATINMRITDLLSETFSALLANKARSGLTILGIVIGIGSVIAMVSIGQGTQGSITSSIQSLGSNLLTISPGFQRGVGQQVCRAVGMPRL